VNVSVGAVAVHKQATVLMPHAATPRATTQRIAKRKRITEV